MKPEKGNYMTLIHKYLKGESSPDELQNAFKLFESPHRNLNLRIVIYEWWNNEEAIQAQPKSENLSGVLDKIHHQINLTEIQPRKNRKKQIIKYSGIAAILILGFLTGFFIDQLKIDEPVFYTCIAPNGSVSQLLLPDNTMVYLNSGSQIEYSFSGSEEKREVFLEGEAWFDITKNSKKPFVVHTPFYDVKVTGTQFNVTAYKTDTKIVTTLEEGSIYISSTKNTLLRSNEILHPGEQFVYDTEKGNYKINNVNTKLFTSWKENKLIFINMDLKELIVLLERKFGVDIVVSDNIVLDYHYDGTIKNETILEVLELLKETLPINYKIEGQQVIIQKK